MAKVKESEDLKTLRGLIKFAKKERVHNFKYKDFEFNLAGVDPTEARLSALEKEVSDLSDLTGHMKLKMDFSKVK